MICFTNPRYADYKLGIWLAIMGAYADQILMLPPELDVPFPMGIQVPQLYEKYRIVDAQSLVEELIGQADSSGDPLVT